MNLLKRILGTAILLAMLAPFPVWGQQAAGNSLGTVTALQGQATVGRVALPQPTPLKFRDDVFFRDQITTKAQSTLRLLLGGKGVLTIREQSQVTLDESVAPTGERRSVLSLLGGKIAAAIARSLMRPGEEVEIRTPNAVAAVRGTVLIAEYVPAQTSAEAPKPILLASSDPNFRMAQAGASAGGQSTFLVLTGSVTVTAQGAPPVTVGAMQTVSISVGPAGAVQVGAVQTASQAQVAQATQGLQMEKSISGPGDGGKAAQAQAQVAATLTNAILQATSGASASPAPPSQPSVSTPVPDATQIPPVPTTALQNDLPSGPLLQLNTLTMAVPTGTSLMTFGPGSANAVVPIGVTGTGMDSTVVALSAANTFAITGNPITHTGPLLGLSAAALVSSDSATPIIQASGTTFTGTATGATGALAALDNASFLETGGNLLIVTGGTLNVTGTALTISGQSIVATGGPLFNIQGKSTVNTSGGPLVRITNGELIASGFGSSDGTGNQITIGGGLLDATNAYVDLIGQPNNNDQVDKTVMAQPAGVPQIRLTSSSLYMGGANGSNGSVVDFGSGTSTFAGLLLIAKDSEIVVLGDLLGVNTGTVSTTEASVPLIQLTNTSVDNTLAVSLAVNQNDLLYIGGTASLTLAGPLLSATGSQLTTGGSLIHLDGSATLTVTTSQPILQLTGVNTDPASGLGTDEVLQVGDGLPVINATFSSGGSINVKGTGSVLSLDTALLNAMNSTVLQISGGTVSINGNPAYADPTGRAGGTIDIYQSNITVNQFASLTNTSIQIANGPLLSLTGGSKMTLNGDFATLSNASITVSNGPLIYLNGSTLNVSGALVNFIGTGSKVVINNSITPTGNTLGGIAYSADATSSVSSGYNVIKNATGNTVSLNGSVIKAVNSSTVNIGTLP
jgi:FecR protein